MNGNNGIDYCGYESLIFGFMVVLCFYWQMSIASDTKVFVVVMFDRAARVLFGCSADEFFDFAKLHPFSGTLTFSSLTPDLVSLRN